VAFVSFLKEIYSHNLASNRYA